MNIQFRKRYISGQEIGFIQDSINNFTSGGSNKYIKLVEKFFEERYSVPKVVLTSSFSASLELALRLVVAKPNDEVIMPSFIGTSIANAVLRTNGLKPVFADIDESTLNITAESIKEKITRKTRAIIVFHYAGIAAPMDEIMELAKKHNLIVIEDASAAIDAKYKGKQLGTIGDFGCLSFHETKNVSCGEGGALFVNTDDKKTIEKVEILIEEGINTYKFMRHEADKQTWVETGLNIIPSDIQAAYLYGQLQDLDKITSQRVRVWNMYYASLKKYVKQGLLTLPTVYEYAQHNGHIFYVLLNNHLDRVAAGDHMKKNRVSTPAHFIPLHSTPVGHDLGYTKRDLPISEKQAGRLIRLPLYPTMTDYDIRIVLETLRAALNTLGKHETHSITTAKVVKKVGKIPVSKKLVKAVKRKGTVARAK